MSETEATESEGKKTSSWITVEAVCAETVKVAAISARVECAGVETFSRARPGPGPDAAVPPSEHPAMATETGQYPLPTTPHLTCIYFIL